MYNSSYYFIGIGGIGMSSIARFLLKQGVKVGGYDKTRTPLTEAMEIAGIEITYDDSITSIPHGFASKDTQVIYTPAVPQAHPQKCYFEAEGNSVQKRAVFLGEITRNIPTIAVAGTHGKTTTTAILSHLFSAAKQSFTAFIGGLVNGGKTNLVSTGLDLVLVEADEFDRSFLHLQPALACITSIDADHLDIYGTRQEVEETYRQFFKQIKSIAVVEKSLPFTGITYSINEKADYCVSGLRSEGFGYRFNLHTPSSIFEEVYFSQLGLHNLSNALAAFSLASQFGIDESILVNALGTFQGVERRLQLVLESPKHILIDDYAHHPTEINAIFETLDQAYPNKEKCVVFQPHLYSRTRDFMAEFAEALSKFDWVFLLPIYPARELPIAGVNSNALAKMMSADSKVTLLEKDQIPKVLKDNLAPVKVMMGAGDIGLEVERLRQKLVSSESV